MFALAPVLTLASIHILIGLRLTLVRTSKIIQKWCPRRLQRVRKLSTNTTGLPTGKKSRPGRRKMPPRCFQGAPGRLQDASKTPPGWVKDGFKPLRDRARFLSRFRDPKMISKNVPRDLQDTSRTLLRPYGNSKIRPTYNDMIRRRNNRSIDR